jgi:hypothetical protein
LMVVTAVVLVPAMWRVAGWPDTRFGLVANAFILGLIYLSPRSQ